MTVRPILFSAPMIRALLDGKKTQTRRVAKFIEPIEGGRFHIRAHGGGSYGVAEADVARVAADYAPYEIGDLLWVRETWWHGSFDFTPDQYKGVAPEPALFFRATDGHRPIFDWKPSIHMPRWASRLTLTVKDVRVQKLRRIGEADALAEGVEDELRDNNGNVCWTPATMFFENLWDTINGNRPGCAWDDNPWVVALTFDVHRMNIDAYLASHKDAAE